MNETEPASPNFRMVGYVAAWAAGLTMLGLIVGGGIEQLAGAISTTATNVAAADRSGAQPGHAAKGIDYSMTGGVNGQPTLNPCQR
jgi:hypothetical protein